MLQEMLNNKEKLSAYLEEVHGYDLAQEFITLSDDNKSTLYNLLDYDQLAELVSYLDAEEAADILSQFDLNKQKILLESMEPDDAVDIIQELESEEQDALIQVLDESSDVLTLIEYDEEETGSLMTSQVLTIEEGLDVKVATKKVIKEAPEVESINKLFIVDESHVFKGVVALKDLLKAKSPLTINDLIKPYPSVVDKDSIQITIQKINQYNIYEMPVTNSDGILLGMVTLDDALEAYEEEAQEDFERLAALPETVEGSAIKIAFHRFPWLLMLLFVSIPVSLLAHVFNDIITAVAVIVIFQPMISGAAGNVATQTLAATLRTFASNDGAYIKNGIKEIITGLFNGILIGALAFVITYGFSSIQTAINVEPIKMASVVSIAMIITVVLAPLIAMLIPSILKTLKIDPAVASGPMITTVLDMTTVFVYFGLATLLLGVIL